MPLTQREPPLAIGRPENNRRVGHHRSQPLFARAQQIFGMFAGRDVPGHGLDVDDLVSIQNELHILAQPDLDTVGRHDGKLVVGRRNLVSNLMLVEAACLDAIVGAYEL